jgi:hypothetical protein
VSKPTIRELIKNSRNGPADGNALLILPKDREAFDMLFARATAGFLLAERVEKLLALHSKDERGVCYHCSVGRSGYDIPWPCDTVKRLEGE